MARTRANLDAIFGATKRAKPKPKPTRRADLHLCLGTFAISSRSGTSRAGLDASKPEDVATWERRLADEGLGLDRECNTGRTLERSLAASGRKRVDVSSSVDRDRRISGEATIDASSVQRYASVTRKPRVYAHELELHLEGKTYRDIGAIVGASRMAAHRRVLAAKRSLELDVEGELEEMRVSYGSDLMGFLKACESFYASRDIK